ncbi:Imm1 family immunity protein [Saccharothrix sp. NRRL B-16314]|uniref:Imm1 family immunity protein n=1 Tax=Saccharothrix sp. NRRL B-16314 TaxID=1463825 RepID=UPI0009DD71A4|nr:Imm1 family immunity protein [Saccharothrix sp. NRRL B-16314]
MGGLGEGLRRRPRCTGLDFLTHCEIPVADIAVAIEEFLATGQRPTLLPWQQMR